MAANNAAPLQPLPEFHTTVSSVNFECTRALSRKRTLAPIESTRPTGRRREEEPSHLGIKLRPPNKDNVSRCSSNTEQSKYRAGFSPPPLSLHLLLLPHIFVIFGSPMFTHPIARRFGTTRNRFPCTLLALPLISTRFSPRGSLSPRIRNLALPSSPRRGRIARVAHSNPGRAKNRNSTSPRDRLRFSSLPPSLPASPPAYFRNLWIADVYAATQIQSKSTLDGY